MPYTTNGKRDYDKEKRLYEDKHPKRKKDRAERNKARAIMAKKGLVHKGDGKDVDHKKPLSKGGKTTPGNLRVQSAHNNRSYARTSSSKVK